MITAKVILKLLLVSPAALLAGGLSIVSQLHALRLAQQELSGTDQNVGIVLIMALGGLSVGSFLECRWRHHGSRMIQLSSMLLIAAGVVVAASALLGRDACRWMTTFGLPRYLEALLFALGSVFSVNVLLGGIVPLLAGSLAEQNAAKVQTTFGWVYAIETCGAASTSLAFSFHALPRFGLQLAVLGLAIGAIGVGVCGVVSGFFFSKRKATSVDPDETALNRSESLQTANELRDGKTRLVLIFSALCGSAASLGMELIWNRYLAIIYGSDSHSYAVVAAVFLIGVSLGSMVAAVALRKQASMKLYSWLMLLVGCTLVGSVAVILFGMQLESFRWCLEWIDSQPLFGRLTVALLVLFVPAFVMGMALPVLTQLWTSHQQQTAKSNVGQIYGWVILGNVMGLLICTHLLVPAVGLKGASLILSLLCLLVATTVRLSSPKKEQGSSRGKLVSHAGFAGVLLAASGIAAYLATVPLTAGLAEDKSWELEHYAENASHTVAVIQSTTDPNRKRLLVDGVTIGESGGGVDEKQQMLAHLPFCIGNELRRKVFSIGLGSGVLAGELLDIPEVESVTCVELSDAVIRAAEYFSEQTGNVLDQPKLSLLRGDGVRHLRASPPGFDVIISDGKSRPGASSNLPFFSREYYELCAQRLSGKGVFAQWVTLRCDRAELETILVTFRDSFPHGYVALGAPDSIYLVGSKIPLVLDANRIKKHLAQRCAESLKQYGWRSVDDFMSMAWIEDDHIGWLAESTSQNTFDRPVLERFAWKSFSHSVSFQKPQFDSVSKLLEEARQSGDGPLGIDGPERVLPTRVRDAAGEILAAESILFAQKENWLDLATARYKKAMQILPGLNRQKTVVQAFRHLAASSREVDDRSMEYSALINIAELKFAKAEDEFRMAQILEGLGRYEAALLHTDNAVNLSDGDPKYRIALGECCMKLKKYHQAIRQFDLALETLSKSGDEKSELSDQAKLLKAFAQQQLGQNSDGRFIFGQ